MEKQTRKIPEQIDIMINSECNARCQMCIQEITYKVPTGIEDPFLNGVKKHMDDYCGLGGKKVIITGGEPTLMPKRVLGVLEELTKYPNLELMAMYTNGSKLLGSLEDRTVAQALKEGGLKEINLSIHHYDNDKNRRIFGIDVGHTESKSRHLNDISIPYRFCATLQKGGLENVDDVIKYLDFAQNNGARDVYLRELFRVFNANTSDEKVRPHLEYLDYNFVPLKPIINGLREKGLITVGRRNDFQGRAKDEIAFVTQKGFPFYTSQLEIGREDSEKLPYLVVMPNGSLYSTWMGEQHKIESLRSFIQGENKK